MRQNKQQRFSRTLTRQSIRPRNQRGGTHLS